MKKIRKFQSVLITILGFIFILQISSYSEAKEHGDKSKSQQSTSRDVNKKVEKQTEKEVIKKRKMLISEAVEAVTETRKALMALDKDNPSSALAFLEKAVGKFETILAREPSLSFAPVDVAVEIQDINATVEEIEKTKEQIEDYIEDDKVQKARSEISGLASEIVISVTKVPLKTYPIAIKSVIPLIDKGKLDKAKAELQEALNTLVIEKHVLPLPILKAEAIFQDAEALSEKQDRTREEKEKLASLLKDARMQLNKAESLGYGTKEDFQKLYGEIKEIEKKTEGSKSGKGFFDKVKQYITDIKQAIMK